MRHDPHVRVRAACLYAYTCVFHQAARCYVGAHRGGANEKEEGGEKDRERERTRSPSSVEL